MAYIYYIWSSKSETGGYIGLDRNPYNSYATSRIAAHIHNITQSQDSASRFIIKEGISNVFYGIWDESQNFGIDQSVYNRFYQEGWVSGSQLQTAEVFHILYDMYYNLHRSDANIVIGGQSRGHTIEWKPKNYHKKIKPDPVSIHVGDKKANWNIVRKKLFFPEQYGIMHKIAKVYLVKFLTDTSLWKDILTKILNGIPYTQTNLKDDFHVFLKQNVDQSFSWSKYNIHEPNIDFSKFYSQFMSWFKQALGNNINNLKHIPKKVFTIKAIDYGMFTPITNVVPFWYSNLLQQKIKVPAPENRTPNKKELVEIVQKATARMFKNIFDNTPKLSNYNIKPLRQQWLKKRVESQVKKLGFNINKFYNWDKTYRCYATLWLEYYKHQPLIPTNMSVSSTGQQLFYSYQQPYPPNYYYAFSSTITDVITTIKKPTDVPFHLL